MRKIQMVTFALSALAMSMLIAPPAPAAEKTDIQKNLNRVIPKYSLKRPEPDSIV